MKLKYFVKYFTVRWDTLSESHNTKYYEDIVELSNIETVDSIYKAIKEVSGVYPDGIEFMVVVP